MKVSKFNQLTAKYEGKKKEVNIAQISEVIKIANELTNGVLYKVIQLMPDQS